MTEQERRIRGDKSKFASQIKTSAWTALEGRSSFIVESALHLGVATAINLIVVIHFCNYNGDDHFLATAKYRL